MTKLIYHRDWAKYYDEVNHRCFGAYYDELTRQTLQLISKLGAGLQIIDFGAGTGRIALPLAALGHRVTAVEPSEAMLAQLASKDISTAITQCHASMQSYDGVEGFDLALAVFTVLGYITKEEDLVASFCNVARVLKPNGRFLIDIPQEVLFSSHLVQREGLERNITFVSKGANHYLYREKTRLELGAEVITYQEELPMRYWTPDEIKAALQKAGLVLEKDYSSKFAMAGASYWLCRKV
jgi:ubiquinone/menaquinone biosynthesis C-methylase UbiE